MIALLEKLWRQLFAAWPAMVWLALILTMAAAIETRHSARKLVNEAAQLEQKAQQLARQQRNLRLEYAVHTDLADIRHRALHALNMRVPSTAAGDLIYFQGTEAAR